MKPKLYFISGLPRSGSTLLSAILSQNPDIYASISSPLGALFNNVLLTSSPANEHAVFFDDEKKKRLLRGLFENWYEEQADREIVFDSNRLWCARMPAITTLFPQAKIICCVRNVAWIMDSIERLIRHNALAVSQLFNDAERATVYTRVEALAQYDRLVGFSWAALREAFYGEQASALLLVDYDLLAQAPEQTLKLIYEFIEEPWFPHDFTQVSSEHMEYDERLGTPGLHSVDGPVQFKQRRTVLPPDLFQRYAGLSFWQEQHASSANVITAKPKQAVKTDDDISDLQRNRGSTIG